MTHSMGGYMFKHLFSSSTFDSKEKVIFDNIILAMTDVNNKDHEKFVDRIRCRNNIYVTINKKDKALRMARWKFGEKQLARLGHWKKNLISKQAIYIDFSNAKHVNTESHGYFEDKPIAKNKNIREFFQLAVNGEDVEEVMDLEYNISKNYYKIL